MRIAFCITDLDPGGAEKALVQLIRHLDRTKWEPHVFCLGPEAELAGVLRELGVPVECLGMSRFQLGSAVRRLAARLRTLQPELLQCLLFHANFVGRIAGKFAGVPVILAGHRVAEREHRWHLWLERLTRRWVNHHVCVSQGVAEHLIQSTGVPASAVTVIPNGVEPIPVGVPARLLREELGLPTFTKVMLAIGRLHPQKGFLLLLDGMRLIVDDHPDVHLVIIGEGPQRRELEKRIQDLQLTRHVTLLGYRPQARDWLGGADLFILSSQWEGMPNVLLEAMAAGVPVVATMVEGVAEVLTPERTGLAITPVKATVLATQVKRLLDDPALAARISQQAQELMGTEFTPQIYARTHEQLYERLRKAAATAQK